MEENTTMINEIEENNNVEMTESNSTLGEKALATAVIGFVGIGIVATGKWIVGKTKGFFAKRKAAKVEEPVDEPDEDEVDSEEESD